MSSPSGNIKFCFPRLSMFPSTSSRETLRLSGKQNSLFPSGADIKCIVICFKRCPFLRTYLTELIRAVWLSGTVPAEWKRACTILIHKQGEASNPSNFRPITLESVPLKVFTSCLRNSMYSFLTANQYIEHNIQKGFTPNLSGTLEHTTQMVTTKKRYSDTRSRSWSHA